MFLRKLRNLRIQIEQVFIVIDTTSNRTVIETVRSFP
jgi:hypothetical protein